MPVIARYNFDDAGTVAADSALGNGAQDGLYVNGAAGSGGFARLDGQNDFVKVISPVFQLARGTLEISFVQDPAQAAGAVTLLSRDSTGQTPGGFRIEIMPDGAVVVTHEGAGTSNVITSPAGTATPGDTVTITYSWDAAGPGQLNIVNTTAGTSFAAPVPAGLTMDMGPINQPWMVGAGQASSDPGALNNLGSFFQGSVDYFQISDSVDNLSGTPTPQPDTAETDEDTPVTIPVLDNDTDPQGQPLTIVGTPTAPNGTVTVNPDGTITYTPNPDYNGSDTITYTVRDPDGNEATSTVTVTVNPVNDAPVANPDTATTTSGVPVTIPVLLNDTDVDGDPLAILGTPTATEGTVTVNPDGTITFTPPADFAGTSTITYEITDGEGGTATSTVTVLVGAPGRDGIVRGTPGGDLIDGAYVDPFDGDRIDANDAIIPGDGPNDDRVVAGDGDDTVRAGADDDTVFGGTGNDSLFGGPGDDQLFGEDGDDTIFGGDGSDSAFGGDGNDLIDTRGGGTAPLPDRDYPGLYAADSDPLDDRDTVFGGRGDDTILTGDDNDVIFGGRGADLIDGGFDDDEIFGGRDNDTLIGNEGADTIYGEDGADLIFGGAGPSVPDAVNIRDDQGDLRPDNGTDLLFGGAGNDTILGLDDNDTIYGDEGTDRLDGGIDEDSIFGGAGNDTIIGGQGSDTMAGGADRDLFLVGATGDGIGDVIDGNEEGDDFDTLDLRGSGPLRVTFASDNPENGVVDFFDADGNPVGQLSFVNIENVIPCFTPGTLIATPRGEVPVEELKAGDKVLTRDNGIQEIRWFGAKHLDWAQLCANPHLKPVLIRRGSLGHGLPERDMMVSPNHRMLVANDRTALYFEEHEVLVAAKHLVGAKGVQSIDAAGTTYLHMLFDRHEVVLANGAWTESFQPGDWTLKGMGNAQRQEIFEIFPELATDQGVTDYQAARRTLKKHEAALLLR